MTSKFSLKMLGFLIACAAGVSLKASAGYYTQNVNAGMSYIAPSLRPPTESIVLDPISGEATYTYGEFTLRQLTNDSPVPVGTEVSLWHPLSSAWSSPSVMTTTGWSIDYRMALGLGIRLTTPTSFSLVISGQVHDPVINNLASPEIWSLANSAYRGFYQNSGPQWYDGDQPFTDGYYLLGSGSPVSAHGFEELFGRAPVVGEQIVTVESSYTYMANGNWRGNGYDSPVSPTIAPGEAAFFNLGPVPEPSVTALAVLGAGLLLSTRRR